MSLAPLMLQRKVDPCPFAMVRGSAVKLAIKDLPVSPGPLIGGLFDPGGSGGGGGTFFLHPAAITRSDSARTMAIRFHKCDLIFSDISDSSPVVTQTMLPNQNHCLLQTGFSLLPDVVSACFCVP